MRAEREKEKYRLAVVSHIYCFIGKPIVIIIIVWKDAHEQLLHLEMRALTVI